MGIYMTQKDGILNSSVRQECAAFRYNTILNPPDTSQPENSPSMLFDWMLSDHFGFGMDACEPNPTLVRYAEY